MNRMLTLSAAALMMTSAAAFADTVTVVTSFPRDLTDPFKAAFETAYPGTTLEVVSRNTNAAVSHLQETRGANTIDLMWASAPDAFEVLKEEGLLAKVDVQFEGIPDAIGGYPVHDPDGTYFGFAASGYGIMYNTRYVQANDLPVAQEWEDLKRAEYNGHVAMSSPSRSGTTHLTVETVLQGEGWDQGWATWKWISGNMNTVTERSFGVPDAVNSGATGFGIVIDFFGLASKASGFPVELVYPSVTAIVPANIGIIENAPNQEGARQFVEFLLSPEGQQVLLNPAIMRLPVNPEAYANAPEGFPNPFSEEFAPGAIEFDVDKSGVRYNLVNSLFDVLVTYRLDDLRAAVAAVQKAEAAHAETGNEEAAALIAEARALVEAMPITEEQSLDPSFTQVFTISRAEPDTEVVGRQAEVEQSWDSFAVENYRKAKELADQAAALN
ncbi:ABC transporter substrate-binding protein [Paracoccus denitrificans]|uniref:Extracellular solute-binding protein, family 1 n=1 Tax=Paracoccus denitrificans (strain Pd 1222) TaxID=318586 RepID=A1BB25_PARDP|nr:extracellular solute-binding protein [Paracoccus denitrificans]ABL72719.1 extracellular solute-binding protein, family 1 [Paracoccus denitrificans PD1222]MBB4626197.1 ABC-type Fe3+ transport system substrate-binding protein [Paracoccus denitrificans]MCU7427595.1 extracellular solute-binding protein [Paracoccus denitrificans]QAR29688.1 extracellular solute-binding protein [Paracoccus denitrificans]UFS68423.1 extracellular solute-binding protein [Paracoccus denitrificans]